MKHDDLRRAQQVYLRGPCHLFAAFLWGRGGGVRLGKG